ncbi:MAG: invasion associated locus B family protein [Rhizobiales bacterium]|nr:invasion associated locus B family protein [Hyphomicrobiales bacterium]
MRISYLMTILPLGVSLSFSQATAQSPQRTTVTFNDWTVACEYPADNKDKTCELVQMQLLPGQVSPTSQVTVGLPNKERLFKVSIQVPPNVWLAEGVKLLKDEKDSGVSLTFRWCVAARCLADSDVKEDALKRLRDASEIGQLVFKDAKQENFVVPVSFRGFGSAFDLLLKESAGNDVVASSPAGKSSAKK